MAQVFYSADEKPRKKRASRPKVRTGCVTCKYRRNCEYYETPDRRTRASRLVKNVAPEGAVALVPQVPAHQVDLTTQEQYFLDFFRRSTSFQCAGYFYDEFWQRLVHQASEDQPAIRHAVIGMGSMNYHFVRSRAGPSPCDQQFSLRQINKAIHSLQRNLIKEGMGRLRVETVLVACVVLVSTLLFQEDAVSAGLHLRSGYKLLEQYLMENGNQSDVAATLTRAFAGTHMVWSSFNSNAVLTGDQLPIPLLLPPQAGATDEIQRANDLMVTLVRILSHQNNAHRSSIESVGPTAEVDPADFVGKLLGLQGQLRAYRDIHKHHLIQRDLNALTILELWAELLPIIAMVETGPGPREMQYDNFLEHFQRILQLADSVLMSDNIDAPTFSVNLGVIPPLCLLAFKCRDPFVRQEALSLLRRSRRQEGIWSTGLTALVVQRVYEIECAGLRPGDLIPNTSRIRCMHVDVRTTESRLCILYHTARACQGDDCRHLDSWESEWLAYKFGHS
ncbi:hypothetical protein N7460_002032 [Penicillium canescens]|uniref:Zn(2)-C6 fungal-type domain-containing protein n=1 Tax=Penicillium canescens TaxID=5083 RepID=A0AAD6IJ42_PENCN|nr:hypothetical protein N7460_002032 [Penicillium canescens]KAJ6182969.1 hypothetical protein N7485_001611 [Penicillium canescens]